jgi:succinate dehydrogenase / fumarate reductase, membrane anchor subunit
MSVRNLGSARAGLYAWLSQRISALYIAGFSLFATLRLMMSPVDSYDAWRAWLSGGPMRLALAVFLAAILVHAWVGMRSVWMDYLHSSVWRFGISVLTGLGLLVLVLWGAQILLWDLRS